MGRTNRVYFGTIKKMSGKAEDVTPDDYNWFKLVVESKGVYVKHCYEMGKTHRLHMHIIFNARSGLYLAPFLKEGYHVHIKVAEDVDTLLKYIDKQDDLRYRKLDNLTLTNPNGCKDLSDYSLGYVKKDSPNNVIYDSD